MQISESPDAKSVGRMKLRLQEITTCIAHLHQLEKVSRGQEHLKEKCGLFIFIFMKYNSFYPLRLDMFCGHLAISFHI